MDPRHRHPHVTHANNGSLPRWCFSTMSGDGIAGLEVHIYRFAERRGVPVRGRDGWQIMVRHSSYGTVVGTQAEADAIGCRDGVIYPYTRNTSGFVMSRAARRRGLATADQQYARRAALFDFMRTAVPA